MKKILYIGHAYHNKTKSSSFIKDLLAQKYELETYDFDPYSDDMQTHFLPLEGKKYDILVCWQVMPDIIKLKEIIPFEKGVFFPMYDGVPSRKDKIWLGYSDFHIINFSKTLHNELKKLGFCSHYFQYFPKPQQVDNWGDEKSIFFWQRVTPINIKVIEKLVDKDEINHIHIHKAIDPLQEFIEPSASWNEKISYSDWFEHRNDMLLKMQESAIYVAPRVYEGIGMSFLEAMAMGRCVISPDNPTMNEYIENGKTGILYDLSNPKKLDLSDIRQIQKNALKYIEEGYKNWIKKQKDILNVIDKPVKSQVKKEKFNQYTKIKYYLFGFLPFIAIKEKSNKKYYNLFGFIPLLKIKGGENKRKIYLFNFIPLLKIKRK